MNGTVFGIPFWMIVAGGIGYLIWKKKTQTIAPAPPTGLAPGQTHLAWEAMYADPGVVPTEMAMDPSYGPPVMEY
jgi:hypothetical protein